jgi:hypothetical protein
VFALLTRVNQVAQGDPTIIARSGFGSYTQRRAPALPREMTAPLSLTVTALPTPGKVELRWRHVAGAGTYIVQMSADGGAVWTQVALPLKATVHLTGQPVATKVLYRVAAVGKEGPGPFCTAVSTVTS